MPVFKSPSLDCFRDIWFDSINWIPRFRSKAWFDESSLNQSLKYCTTQIFKWTHGAIKHQRCNPEVALWVDQDDLGNQYWQNISRKPLTSVNWLFHITCPTQYIVYTVAISLACFNVLPSTILKRRYNISLACYPICKTDLNLWHGVTSHFNPDVPLFVHSVTICALFSFLCSSKKFQLF